MSTYRYKGQGIWQTTGKVNMSSIGTGILAQPMGQQLASSLSPITITSSGNLLNSINGASANWTNSPFDYQTNTHTNLKKYEVYESTESVLTLSCAAKRLHQENKIFYKITDHELYNRITPDDRTMADQIKDYYSKKVMMWKLKGNGSLSPFREDMNKLIHSDMLMFKENMIGIAYWLPHFYQYDIEFDSIKAELDTNQNFKQLDKDGKPSILRITEELIPITRLERKTKRNKYFEYWFKDSKLNAGVVIHLEEKNQLQHLWDTIFNQSQPLKINGSYSRRSRDDFDYFSISNWNLA